MKLRVLLADDHTVVRQALHQLLTGEPDLELVAEAEDALEIEAKVEQHRPDVVVLDVQMPALNGLEVLRRIRARFRRTQVLMLSMHTDRAYVLKALDLGASGYVTKCADAKELIRAIREVGAGREYLSEPFEPLKLDLARMKAAGRSIDLYDRLTRREKEVLQLIAEGLTNKEVAQRLGIKERTVETHRANIMKKLGRKNLAELVRFAVEWGLLERQGPPPELDAPPAAEIRDDRTPPAPS